MFRVDGFLTVSASEELSGEFFFQFYSIQTFTLDQSWYLSFATFSFHILRIALYSNLENYSLLYRDAFFEVLVIVYCGLLDIE